MTLLPCSLKPLGRPLYYNDEDRVKFSAVDTLKCFFYFPRKQDLNGDKLHEMLAFFFLGRIKKNTINLSSAELAKRIVKVYAPVICSPCLKGTGE